MKRNLFLLGLAVAAMTSCTNDEVLDIQQPVQNAIGFESFVNKVTRAIGSTVTPSIGENNEMKGLQKFYVYGFHSTTNDFNGATVEGVYDANLTTNPKIKWTHNDSPKYWGEDTYYFAAYANGNNANALSNVSFGQPTPKLTINNYNVSYSTSSSNATTSEAPDLVAAIKSEEGSKQRTDKVNFTFKHLLSKI